MGAARVGYQGQIVKEDFRRGEFIMREVFEAPDGRWLDVHRSTIDVRHAIKEAHYQASLLAVQTRKRRDKKREDKLWRILKEMEKGD